MNLKILIFPLIFFLMTLKREALKEIIIKQLYHMPVLLLLVQCTLSITQSRPLCPSKISLFIKRPYIAVSADSQVGGGHSVWLNLGYLESGGQLCGSVLGICDRRHRESHAETRSL